MSVICQVYDISMTRRRLSAAATLPSTLTVASTPAARSPNLLRHANPSRSSRALHPTPIVSTSLRCGAPAPSSRSNASAPTSVARRPLAASLPAGRLPGARGAGAAQVQDALRPAPRPGPLGRPRRLGRHVGAAGQPHELRGGHLRVRLRAGNWPHPTPSYARAAWPGRGFACPARAGRLRRRGRSAWGSRRSAGGPDDPLLVADGRVAPWQRGTVARLCPRGAFSHVVAYSRQTSALRCTADSLLDAASYGIRWVLLSPAAAAAAGVSHDPPAGPGRRPLASVRVPIPLP
jgi:hypothetical protein